MFCPNCGSKLPDDAIFCGECGQKVGESLRKRMEKKNKSEDPVKISPVRENSWQATKKDPSEQWTPMPKEPTDWQSDVQMKDDYWRQAEEQPKKGFRPIYAAIIIPIFCIAITGGFLLSSGLLQKNDNDGTATVAEATTENGSADAAEADSTEPAAEKTTEKATEAATETTEETDELTAGASATADYTNCKDLLNYKKVTSPEGDYSFSIPAGVYAQKKVDGDNVTYSSKDGDDWVSFSRVENTWGSAEDGRDEVYLSYANKCNNMGEGQNVEDTSGDAPAKKVGDYDKEGWDYYLAVSANDSYVYVMEVHTRDMGENQPLGNYNVECLYCYCSFTAEKNVRSYEEHLADY